MGPVTVISHVLIHIEKEHTILDTTMKIVQLQLTVDGVSMTSGRNVLLFVKEEIRLGVEPAPSLPQLMAELTVLERALRLKDAILRSVQVIFTLKIDP